jgi:hypothetical protein
MLSTLKAYLMDKTQHGFGIIRPLLTEPDGTVISYQGGDPMTEDSSSNSSSGSDSE